MSIEESTARIALRMQERQRRLKDSLSPLSPLESSPVPQGTQSQLRASKWQIAAPSATVADGSSKGEDILL
jgi:hypothetical protein